MQEQQILPLIIQSDRTLLLDVHADRAEECATALIPFAELEKSPEHLHTYKLTPLSLWNAASAGFSADDAVSVLKEFARYEVPQSIEVWISETAKKFGKLRLVPAEEISVSADGQGKASEVFKRNEGFATKTGEKQAGINGAKKISEDGISSAEKEKSGENREVGQEIYICLACETENIFREISSNKTVEGILTPCRHSIFEWAFRLKLTDRGLVKQHLIKAGWPVKDDIPLVEGAPLTVSLRETTLQGKPLNVRDYQARAAQALVGDKGAGTGFGTIVLPCGAGKTVVGMKIMSMLKTNTLIITTNISAVHQWIDELLDKTDLQAENIAEYSGTAKEIREVTVATYQILTWRPNKESPYPHFSIFQSRAWGLIIYDEVHMLPAPVFRVVADLQAVRRVGLTATLVREDGHEDYVFSLVGPKRYDVPWKELERSGWIAKAECIEVRLDLSEDDQLKYASATQRERHRIASENVAKNFLAQQIAQRCSEDKILVIGQYLSQLAEIARLLNAPIITGKTPNGERDSLYAKFKSNEIRILVVSKVANFAIDLPDASVAIQVSGTFGSRQEEAQRLGRILRPKERTSRFFTLVTRNTAEEEFSSNRQKFLAEQGYAYRIVRYGTIEDLAEITASPACRS